MRFKDNNVVVTGASKGIGRETARLFAKEGANVALVARSIDKLEQLKQELKQIYSNQRFLAIRCDVADKEQVLRMSKQILDEFKYVDILVNNAGFAIFDDVINTSIEDIEYQINTNFLGAVYCIKAFLPSMIARNKGHIVNVASLAASIAIPNLAAYCASKFALLGFSQALKHELHGTNIGITVVSPITVRTEFFSNDSFKDAKINLKIALDAKTVAKVILKAARSSRVEITVPEYARLAVWFTQTFPYITNPIIREMFRNMKR